MRDDHYSEGRNAQDIDLILAPIALKHLPELEVIDQNNRLARVHFGELQVDHLLTSNALFQTVQQQYGSARCISYGRPSAAPRLPSGIPRCTL